jgi:hypothetical protein
LKLFNFTLINYFTTWRGGTFSASSGYDWGHVRGRGSREDSGRGFQGRSSVFDSFYVWKRDW